MTVLYFLHIARRTLLCWLILSLKLEFLKLIAQHIVKLRFTTCFHTVGKKTESKFDFQQCYLVEVVIFFNKVG